MANETTPLFPREDNHIEHRKTFKWKYFLIIPAEFFLLLGVLSYSYIVNEWVQDKIKIEKYPQLSTGNVSTCGVVNHSDPVYKNSTIVQQTSAHWMTYFSIAQHVPALFMNLILIGYTDIYGRKFLFIISGIGLGLKLSVITLIIYLDASLVYVLLMFMVDGMLGSKYGMFATTFAYIADITRTEKHRVLGIVCMESVFVLTTTLAGYLTGHCIQTWNLGFFHTALLNTGSCILGLIILFFLVPESLDRDQRRPSQPLLQILKTIGKFYVSNEFKAKRGSYVLLILAFAFAELCGICRNGIETLYFLGEPFCWGPSKIGYFSMTRHLVFGVFGLISIKIFQRFFSNEIIAGIGNISNMASFIVEGLATTDLMIYMVPVAGILSFLIVPMIRGIMSVITDPDKQGAMFSSVAAIEVLSVMLGTIAENEIYAETYSILNGFVFLVMSVFCLIDSVLMFTLYVVRKKQESHKSVNSEIN